MRRSLRSAWVVAVALAALTGCASGGPRASDDATAQIAAKRFAAAFGLMQDEDWPRAEQELERLARTTPQDALVHTNLGIVYGRSGRIDAAVQALETATQLAPSAALAHNELGIAYRKAGDFPRAAAAYRAALKLRPEYANAHYNLGVLLDLYLRQPSAALAHYEAYLALAGGDDKQVQAWVKDLQRRTAAGPATAASDDKVERR